LTRPVLTLVGASVLLLHLLFALVLWYGMKPKPWQQQAAEPVAKEQAMLVRLIDTPHTPRAAQPPEPTTPTKLVPRQPLPWRRRQPSR
jgi:hypothetical protein